MAQFCGFAFLKKPISICEENLSSHQFFLVEGNDYIIYFTMRGPYRTVSKIAGYAVIASIKRLNLPQAFERLPCLGRIARLPSKFPRLNFDTGGTGQNYSI